MSDAASSVLQENPAFLQNFPNAEVLEKLRLTPEMQGLINTYTKQGGDVSGGGFGLIIKGTEHVILHDLWCENRRYQYSEDTSNKAPLRNIVKSNGNNSSFVLSQILPEETALTLSRLKLWSSLAPGLMMEIEKILNSKEIWHVTLMPLKDSVQEQFEFPGSAKDRISFSKKYQEIQVAHVQKFPGKIFINAGLFDRMDLKSRAGLLLHESLRLLYLKSIKGYILPSILQWMTGAIMQRAPALKQDQQMIKAFYEELFVNTDNSDVKDRRRPKAWRTELCKTRRPLVDAFDASNFKQSLSLDNSASETMENLCETHETAIQMLTQRSKIVILKSFNKLPSACQYNKLSEVPTYTLVYWLQKRLDLGSTWSIRNKADVDVDLPYLLMTGKNFFNKYIYEEIIERFLAVGDDYCAKRKDYYGKGEEFLALGDILIESLIKGPNDQNSHPASDK